MIKGMKEQHSINVNPKAYIGMTALPGEVYKVGWVEPTGDLVIQYTPDGVQRLTRMLSIPRQLLEDNRDSSLENIKADIDFCIDFLQHLIDSVYEKKGVRTNA